MDPLTAGALTMARHAPHLVFDAFTIEGGLFTADFLNRIAEETAGQQTVADYRLPKGLQLRDEIGRAWRIAAAHWSELDRASKGGAERLVQATILAMLRDAFGWLSLKEYLTPPMIGDRTFPITAQALGERLPLLVAPWETGLDTSAPSFGDSGRRRTPFGLVQDWLNASDGALWGVVTNGRQLRLVRDNASLTRPAWIEVDLERIMREQRYADFSVLWLLLH
ncbi:MAG TPA: hypothetical protein VNU46_06555, partial [Gemmatimonadaceae bacterium]|nr:hypothetical protein [Gemmatimonadaceae bacterium]